MSANNARHIPEEELHAYLDQALSRSQCVEIECHLAECRRCQLERDEVAAARDRTTSLLAEIAPARVLSPPPFDGLVARHKQRQVSRRLAFVRISRAGLWAASLVGAALSGWWGRGILHRRPAAPAVVAQAPPAAQAPVQSAAPRPEAPAPMPTPESRTLAAVSPVQRVSEPPVAQDRPTIVAERALSQAEGVPVRAVRRDVEPLMMVNSAGADDVFALEGFWQSVDWQEASRQTGGNLPRIEGLPIIDIQLQRNGPDERPLVVVTQQHPGGRLIRTFEGPVERVEVLLDKQLARDPTEFNASVPAFTPPDYLGTGSAAARRGLRVLTVTGHLPTDSLNVMARNIALRD